eukprot:XP_014021007.1 PREDICTED: uncharacterized protein LOC106582426 [Salmo salar]
MLHLGLLLTTIITVSVFQNVRRCNTEDRAICAPVLTPRTFHCLACLSPSTTPHQGAHLPLSGLPVTFNHATPRSAPSTVWPASHLQPRHTKERTFHCLACQSPSTTPHQGAPVPLSGLPVTFNHATSRSARSTVWPACHLQPRHIKERTFHCLACLSPSTTPHQGAHLPLSGLPVTFNHATSRSAPSTVWPACHLQPRHIKERTFHCLACLSPSTMPHQGAHLPLSGLPVTFNHATSRSAPSTVWPACHLQPRHIKERTFHCLACQSPSTTPHQGAHLPLSSLPVTFNHATSRSAPSTVWPACHLQPRHTKERTFHCLACLSPSTTPHQGPHLPLSGLPVTFNHATSRSAPSTVWPACHLQPRHIKERTFHCLACLSPSTNTSSHENHS